MKKILTLVLVLIMSFTTVNALDAVQIAILHNSLEEQQRAAQLKQVKQEEVIQTKTTEQKSEVSSPKENETKKTKTDKEAQKFKERIEAQKLDCGTVIFLIVLYASVIGFFVVCHNNNPEPPHFADWP